MRRKKGYDYMLNPMFSLLGLNQPAQPSPMAPPGLGRGMFPPPRVLSPQAPVPVPGMPPFNPLNPNDQGIPVGYSRRQRRQVQRQSPMSPLGPNGPLATKL